MHNYLLKNAQIVNEGIILKGDVLIQDKYIIEVADAITVLPENCIIIDAAGSYLLPGFIDDQVHFREPGLTHKGTIETESKAAIAGGITSFIEQPNTVPNAITQEILEHKYQIAAQSSYANYSFMMGGTNDNLDEILKTNPKNVAGLKLFLGSSTGNMLVDNAASLEKIFSSTKLLIAVHCEDENTIKDNLDKYTKLYGKSIGVEMHPQIRSEEACYLSSAKTVALAKKTGARLHVFHVSTAKELELFDSNIPLEDKKITAEVCVHHLWFSDKDYESKGNFIKWNPAIKSETDKEALLQAVLNNTIDVIATDHAPHTLTEKAKQYLEAPSGGPLVQHALVALLELFHNKKISLEKIVQKTAHNPAIIFKIEKRGFIKKGFFADLVLVNLNDPWTVSKQNCLYKCGWSPFEGTTFKSKVSHTFVNGVLVYKNGTFADSKHGQRLLFNR